MIISKANDKAYLFRQFLIKTATGWEDKTFKLDKLMAAAGANRKLSDDSTKVYDANGAVYSYKWPDGEIAFDYHESELLLDLIGQVDEATVSEAGYIASIREAYAEDAKLSELHLVSE